MPSINSPLGARPARFRQERLLIVGCGDVGLRVAGMLRGRLRMIALTSSPDRVQALRDAGLAPIVANLDNPASLKRIAGVATKVIHLAPPASAGGANVGRDARTLSLVRALRLRTLPTSLVYASTSGVYGNCDGARVNESRVPRPGTARAHRRVDAERIVRWLGRAGTATRILRIPGIYAPDREGGTPRGRLAKGTPVLRPEDDVFTNHIHADDLARACIAALFRGGTLRAFNVSDDSELRMGDYFDLAADMYGLQRPPRISLAQAKASLAATQLSFMGESRRLDNTRLKRELRVRLRYPTVATGLK